MLPFTGAEATIGDVDFFRGFLTGAGEYVGAGSAFELERMLEKAIGSVGRLILCAMISARAQCHQALKDNTVGEDCSSFGATCVGS